MKISVIIPTLNEEKYIEKTLLHLKTQVTSANYEIIVADGNSEDKTREIAKKYAKVVIARKGASCGRNDGAKKTKGEIICFIDADTLVANNFIDVILKDFKDEELVGWICKIKSDDEKYEDWFDLTNFLLKFFIKIGKPHAAGCAFVIRKDAFNEVGGFDEQLALNEDHDLAFRLKKIGNFKYSDETYVISSTRRIRKWGLRRTLKLYLSSYMTYLLGLETCGPEPVR